PVQIGSANAARSGIAASSARRVRAPVHIILDCKRERSDMKLRKLPVFLTVDTEIWPYVPGWPGKALTPHAKDLGRQFSHCILGTSSEGELGIRYQMFLMNQHGLRATFFVETLHAAVVGDKWLSETVGMIREAGHDVQLHAHPEWLSGQTDPVLPPQQ